MANKTRNQIKKMSREEVYDIGDYYIHNNWRNFDSYFENNKVSHLKDILEGVNSEILQNTKNHIDILRGKAKKFATELIGKPDLKGALEQVAKIYKNWSTTEAILAPMSSLKNISLKMNNQFFEELGTKSDQKITKELFDEFREQIVSFMSAITGLVEKNVIGEGAKSGYYAKKIEERIARNIVKLEGWKSKKTNSPAAVLLEHYKDIESYLNQAFRTNNPTPEDLKKLKEVLMGTVIRRGTEQFANFLYADFGFVFEHTLAESYLEALIQAFEDQLKGKEVDFGAEGDQFHNYAVSDIFIKIDDLKVGFSVKHELSGTSESEYEIDEDNLFHGVGRNALNEYLYLKNNSLAFAKTAKKEAGKNIETLKLIQFEMIKNRYLSRIFDGLYKETVKNPLEIKYFGSEHATITSTVFWIDGERIFYTHDVMESILKEETKWEDRGEYKQDFTGLTLRAPVLKEKNFGLSRYKQNWLKRKKENEIGKMNEITFRGIGEALRDTMIDLISDYPKLFFKKIRFLFKFSELEGKRGIAIPLKG